LKNLSYAVDCALFEVSAPAFRPQQVFWYSASVLAVFAWLRTLLVRLVELERLQVGRTAAEWIAFGTSLLFALHPAHVESVTWLSGRKDVLSGFFVPAALGCGLAYSLRVGSGGRRHIWLVGAASLVFLACGLLSKPTGVAIAPLLLVQEYWIGQSAVTREARRQRLLGLAWLLVPAWILTLAFAAFYAHVVAPYAEAPGVTTGDPIPAPGVRIGQQLARDLQLVLNPSTLTPIVPEHWFSADPWSVAAIAGYFALLALASVLVAGARRRQPLALAVALFVVPVLPSLLKPVWGQYVAGRYLYHALLGPAFALAWLCARTLQQHERLRPLLTAAAAALALVWAGTAFGYSAAFRSSDALWEYSIAVDPTFPRFYDLGARAALAQRDVERAVRLLEDCLKAVPGASECAGPLGGLMLRFDPRRGEALLEQALPRDKTGTAHVRLAQHWSQTGRTKDALELYERWLSGRGTDPEQLGVVVDLALADHQYEKAKRYLWQQIAAASVLRPASPPSAAAIVRAAEQTGDEALAARARAAAVSCTRSDCFASALGVHP
jgi:tetratricopeptide (TPR) repeat protein